MLMAASALMLAVAAGAIITGVVVSNAARVVTKEGKPPMSFYSAYGLYPIHTQSLFDGKGNVRPNVLAALQAQLEETDPDEIDDAWLETTNKHFSNRAKALTGKSSGALIIKLFETADSDKDAPADTKRITALTKGWYQLVYRAQDVPGEGTRDVLTLWAIEPYRTSVFNQNLGGNLNDDDDDKVFSSIHQATYNRDGNYSASIIRHNVRNDYENLIATYPKVNNFFVAPNALPGNWQSSAAQTGTNELDAYYDENAAGGSAGAGHGNTSVNTWSLCNGMDTLGQKSDHWTSEVNSIISLNQDKMWVPSAFETTYMGKDKEDAGFGSYLTNKSNAKSDLRRYVNRTTPTSGQDPEIRHGLWKLNGYDRAFNNTSGDTWLRSGSTAGGNMARRLTQTGETFNSEVNNSLGVRPGFHLDLPKVEQFAQSSGRLETIIGTTKRLTQDYYSSSSWSSLLTAITSAEDALNLDVGTVANMNSAYVVLGGVIQNLEVNPATDEEDAKAYLLLGIAAVLEEVDGLDAKDYTDYSWQQFIELMLIVAAFYDNDALTSLWELDMALAYSNVAVAGLELKAPPIHEDDDNKGIDLMILGIVIGSITILIGLPTIFFIKKPREGKTVNITSNE